ncbi:DUF1778 domain-containing protein [Spirillospora sp. NPDC047279]|uniref:type II toxin -antitoxin system TacA 1-like antitoxin n=1 Tax=Spirillospora sp. NPDC047279 TaxID=3155478 RepID=UPI0033E226E4
MYESVHQDLPVTRLNDHIEFPTSEEQRLVIRKAAELLGWTVPQYVLSAVLDRAERDLYEHAAVHGDSHGGAPAGDEDAGLEPMVAVVTALG